MLRVLPVLIAIVLVVFCLIELAQTPAEDVRALPRPVWAALILLVPFVGPLGWLAAGRPAAGGNARGRTPPRPAVAPPVAPDDNPEFLARLKQHRLKAEDERLRKWQADLERREQELRQRGDDTTGGADPSHG
ncbi:MAG TPA: PLD nuclease N-terminal domain-containing protein [Actinopolymorphaceae bacterium]|nr:PLD nuclease N-terminal domain-containing protein [Actinopolymorphaceae bacterium]